MFQTIYWILPIYRDDLSHKGHTKREWIVYYCWKVHNSQHTGWAYSDSQIDLFTFSVGRSEFVENNSWAHNKLIEICGLRAPWFRIRKFTKKKKKKMEKRKNPNIYNFIFVDF